VKDQLIQRAADFHIVLEDIAITHLTFGKEFASAIEKKQVAQQEAERQVMSPPPSQTLFCAFGVFLWISGQVEQRRRGDRLAMSPRAIADEGNHGAN
jgi:hypothetical protein